LIPEGTLATLPLPVPESVTVNANVVAVLNVAVTASAAFIVTTHDPVPWHAPLQPANDEPVPADAVSVTCWPLLKFAEQPVPPPVVHLMPVGLLVTVPLPVPASVKVSANVAVLVNVAVTERPLICETGILNEQVGFVVQGNVNPEAPEAAQPANVEPLVGVAVSVMGQL
jgi:hypothetical protein